MARRVVYISQLQLGFRYETDPPPPPRIMRAVRTNARKGPPEERPTRTFRVHRMSQMKLVEEALYTLVGHAFIPVVRGAF